jgi:hypothetical protein
MNAGLQLKQCGSRAHTTVVLFSFRNAWALSQCTMTEKQHCYLITGVITSHLLLAGIFKGAVINVEIDI